MKEFAIKGEYITVQQFLKNKDYIASGGEVRDFILNHRVFLNNEVVYQRGKKIHRGDFLEVDKDKYTFI